MASEELLIVGIDPGVTTGVAFVLRHSDGRCEAVEAHTIANDEFCSEATIFTKTYYTLSELFKRGEENIVVGIEGPMKGKFVNFLILKILGVIEFAVTESGLGWNEVPIKTVKKRVTGNGNAGKLEVLRAVEETLGIGLDVANLHISDAYAVCLALAEEI